MRSSKSRSRGNNKNRNNRPSGGSIVNRVFDSSGPEGKVRGTPQQIIEKYTQLYRDAQLSNDRVNAENFAQHAEHYLRLLAEANREMERVRQEQDTQNRERQAERDRERNERLKAQENTANESGQNNPAQNDPHHNDAHHIDPAQNDAHHNAPLQNDPAQMDQPVIEAVQPEESGLVDTPEAQPKPRRARAPRKPKPAPDEGNAPEAAE